MAIVKGAGMIMKAIIEEGSAEIASKMQDLALAEGALPRHLHISMFSQSLDTRVLTMRQLSRNLVSLWCTENETAMLVLKRILPVGLLSALQSDEVVPKDRDLINIRNNLQLAMDNAERKQSRILSQNLMNAQSIKVIEKQLNHVLQHWKQRLNTSSKPDVSCTVFISTNFHPPCDIFLF
jgi:DnaJ family protein C protein 13